MINQSGWNSLGWNVLSGKCSSYLDKGTTDFYNDDFFGMILCLHLQYKTQSNYIAYSIRKRKEHHTLYFISCYELWAMSCTRENAKGFQTWPSSFAVSFKVKGCNSFKWILSKTCATFESSRMHSFSFMCLYSITVTGILCIFALHSLHRSPQNANRWNNIWLQSLLIESRDNSVQKVSGFIFSEFYRINMWDYSCGKNAAM